jgi:hypothetical protein
MKSWQIVADLRPARGPAAALVTLHVMAAALPWACRVEPGTATALSLAALLLLRMSWRRLPVWGGLRGLALDAGSCACRDASGWWPARIEPRSRVWPGLVLLCLSTAAGRMEVLLVRASLEPVDFRRLKVLVRARTGRRGVFC